MNILKRVLSLMLVLCLTAALFTGCGAGGSEEPETTTAAPAQTEAETQPEDYASKKPISGGVFSERAFVNGFGVEDALEAGDSFKSYYVANYGKNDLCQFMESETNDEAAEMFDFMYSGLKETEDSEDVVSTSDIDKGSYHKYIQQRTDRYFTIILLDNTLLFVDSCAEEQPRYEVFIRDINY